MISSMKSDAAFNLGKLTSRWVEFEGVSRLGFLLSQHGGFFPSFLYLNFSSMSGCELQSIAPAVLLIFQAMDW